MESATATVTNFLSNLISNPFSTPVGQLIEKASDVSQASDDWALYMEICDVVNETEDGAKDATRALKKLISNNVGKSNIVIMYTLTILETCVKNCGKKFHIQIAQKDFLQELIKLASPRYNPPHFVLDKVLGLIQTWADAFQDEPDLKEFGSVYQELKEKGCEFPMTDLDHIAPIHTPARSVPEVEPLPCPIVASDTSAHLPAAVCHQVADSASANFIPASAGFAPATAGAVGPLADGGGPAWLDTVQLAKLRSELDVVQQNCRVFGDLITEATPGQQDPEDYKLMQELDKVCREMQQRIVELIERVQNEEVTGNLLQVNDLLNNVSLRYERFERLRSGASSSSLTGLDMSQTQPTTLPLPGAAAAYPPAAVSAPTCLNVQTGTLVDIGDVHMTTDSFSSATAPPPQLVAPPRDEEEFDMFAQSRQSFEQNLPKVNSSAYQDQSEDQVVTGLAKTMKIRGSAFKDEAESDEMEQWLKSTESMAVSAAAAKDSATSSEFDKFLATREKVAAGTTESDALTGVPSQRSSRNGRAMQNEADDDKALFSL